MARDCGACNLCCKLLHVPDIHKPAQMLCWWTTVHGGCSRQADKEDDPTLAACAQFQCLWLASQSRDEESERQPRWMRPDITHVVMGPRDREDDTLIYVQVDPKHPGAWREPEIQEYLNGIVSRGGKYELIIGEIRLSSDDVHAS